METFFYVILATSVPLLFYFFIALVNHKIKLMDQELERRTDAASLTTAELEALVHEVVSERLSVMLERTERTEQRIEGMEQLLAQPEQLQPHGNEHEQLLTQDAALPEKKVESGEMEPEDMGRNQTRTRST